MAQLASLSSLCVARASKPRSDSHPEARPRGPRLLGIDTGLVPHQQHRKSTMSRITVRRRSSAATGAGTRATSPWFAGGCRPRVAAPLRVMGVVRPVPSGATSPRAIAQGPAGATRLARAPDLSRQPLRATGATSRSHAKMLPQATGATRPVSPTGVTGPRTAVSPLTVGRP